MNRPHVYKETTANLSQTKVVNIKTDFPLNIHVSIREKKYAAIEKVSERISDVYEARHSPNEKVIFLFSVNGSKKFCGLAEMSGPWDTSDVIHGWEESSQSANVKGYVTISHRILDELTIA